MHQARKHINLSIVHVNGLENDANAIDVSQKINKKAFLFAFKTVRRIVVFLMFIFIG